MNICNTSLNESLDLFKDLREFEFVSIGKVESYMNTPGMKFLNRHMKKYGNGDLCVNTFLKNVDSALKNEDEQHVFIQSIRRGYKNQDLYKQFLHNTDLKYLNDTALNEVCKYLPEALTEEYKVYMLCGIRGTSIVLGNEVAIDVCDETLEVDGKIDTKRVVDILAHELHHLESNRYMENIICNSKDDREKRYLKIIGDILSEGTANYYITNPFERECSSKSIWLENMKDLKTIFKKVEEVIYNSMNDPEFTEEDTWCLFDENAVGYTVGYVMVSTIHEIYGKEKVMACIKDCSKTIKYYNDAVELGKLDLPTIRGL